MKDYTSIPTFSLKVVKEKTLRYPSAKCSASAQAAVIARAFLQDKDCENLIVIMCDNAHNYIGIHLVAIGGIGGIHVQPRDCFKAAIVHRASAIILSHNHPSGSSQPSQEDDVFTRKVREGGEVLGIPVLDHIIIPTGVVSSGYYSYSDNNR